MTVRDDSAATIGDIAELVRSKNAGPFWQTLDIFCATDDAYAQIAAAGVLTPERIATLYRVDPGHVRIFRMPNIRVVKVSFPRRVSSGSAFDRDVHAGQQHVLLRDLALDPAEDVSTVPHAPDAPDAPHAVASGSADVPTTSQLAEE